MKSKNTAVSASTPRRGRPPKRVFINVEVRATTRDGLNGLKRRTGLQTQGAVLDWLIAKATN